MSISRDPDNQLNSILTRTAAWQLSKRGFLRMAGLTAAAWGSTSLLAACGDDEETPEAAATETPSGVGPSATDTPGAEGNATPTEGTDDPGEGQAGGTMRIVVEQNPVSLDPAFVRDVGSTRVVWYMYDSLLDRDENDETIPWLATQWEMSDPGTEYTLTLREGVMFHDGTPLNAEAVKYSFERLGDPELESRFIDEFPDRISSVEAVDETTVLVTTPNFYAPFVLEYLANYAGHIVSPTAAEAAGKDFALNPVGSGPFKFSSFEPDSALELVRNEDYWDGAPLIENFIVRIIPEQGVQIVELEAGNIDLSFSVQAKDVERLEGAGIQIYNAPPPTATWVSMNLAKGFTQELEVRQAIALAMDRDAIVSEFLLGYGVVSRGGTPPDWPRYHDDIPEERFDMEEAGRILDEAGWVMGSDGVRERDGERLKVNVLSTQLERALSYGLMNQYIQQQLTELGFETEIQTQEWGAYLDEFRAGSWWEVTFHAQNAQARELVGATFDPDAYWNVNQHAKVTEEPLASMADDIRDIYQRMNSEPDFDQRIAIWKEMQLA